MRDRSKAFNFERDEKAEEFPLEINGEEVMCVPDVDGMTLLEYTATMHRSVPVSQRAAGMMTFLQECIVERDWERFREIVKKHRFDIEAVAEIAGYLSGVYSTRPTESVEPSSAGQTTTGSSSEASSSSEGSTGGA